MGGEHSASKGLLPPNPLGILISAPWTCSSPFIFCSSPSSSFRDWTSPYRLCFRCLGSRYVVLWQQEMFGELFGDDGDDQDNGASSTSTQTTRARRVRPFSSVDRWCYAEGLHMKADAF
jgi:hypothetical protein